VLKARPDVIQHIARVVWMGGAVDVMGNVEELSPKAEWNVYADPASAQYIWQLPASVPIWMMPLDATNALPLTRNFLYSLSFACPDSFISEAYHATAQKTQYYFWDVATVVWLLRPELIESSVIRCWWRSASTPVRFTRGCPCSVWRNRARWKRIPSCNECHSVAAPRAAVVSSCRGVCPVWRKDHQCCNLGSTTGCCDVRSAMSSGAPPVEDVEAFAAVDKNEKAQQRWLDALKFYGVLVVNVLGAVLIVPFNKYLFKTLGFKWVVSLTWIHFFVTFLVSHFWMAVAQAEQVDIPWWEMQTPGLLKVVVCECVVLL
jgi:hypothetical protein